MKLKKILCGNVNCQRGPKKSRKLFKPSTYRVKCCCMPCGYEARHSGGKALKERPCAFCGESFQPAENSIRHCSQECAYNARSGAPADIGKQILKLVKRKRHTLIELADAVDVSPSRVRKTLESLKAAHHLIDEDSGAGISAVGLPVSREHGDAIAIDAEDFFGKGIRFGALGDTHLGSKWERLDVLNALYDIYKREGIKHVYHTGNIIEGECRFNRFDVRVHGFDAQIDYCIQNYPQRKGITTHFITGLDHEGWYIAREGIDVGRHLQDAAEKAGRKDLVYIGNIEVDLELKAKSGFAVMRVMHPGGGSAYATSYTVQKIVEGWQSGEKARVLLCGHYHKAEYGYPREVHCLQTGTCQDQSNFMRRMKIQAHVGGWIVSVQQADTGEITRFSSEFIPFYDRGFYQAKYAVGLK